MPWNIQTLAVWGGGVLFVCDQGFVGVGGDELDKNTLHVIVDVNSCQLILGKTCWCLFFCFFNGWVFSNEFDHEIKLSGWNPSCSLPADVSYVLFCPHWPVLSIETWQVEVTSHCVSVFIFSRGVFDGCLSTAVAGGAACASHVGRLRLAHVHLTGLRVCVLIEALTRRAAVGRRRIFSVQTWIRKFTIGKF